MTVAIPASVKDAETRLLVREATAADDAQICAHMLRTAMPGRISLATSCTPSFFESIEVEGRARVAVAEQDHLIVGVGLIASKRVYLNGLRSEVGYISSLRTDPSIRSKTALVRGNRLFRKWHEEDLRAPFYLCSILQDNHVARDILTSGRAGLPASREIGTLYTAAIPLIKRRQIKPPIGVRIVTGNELGAEAIIETLDRLGSRRQFSPTYTVSDLTSASGVLRGLHTNDFHAALSGDRIIGLVARWNQLPFRQTVVAGYYGSMKIIQPLLSALARAFNLAPLPRANDPIESILAACMVVENDDRSVFDALLNTALRSEYNTRRTFLLAGLMEGDPLLDVVKRHVHLPARSCIYSLHWDAVDIDLDDRLPYLELGSL